MNIYCFMLFMFAFFVPFFFATATFLARYLPFLALCSRPVHYLFSFSIHGFVFFFGFFIFFFLHIWCQLNCLLTANILELFPFNSINTAKCFICTRLGVLVFNIKRWGRARNLFAIFFPSGFKSRPCDLTFKYSRDILTFARISTSSETNKPILDYLLNSKWNWIRDSDLNQTRALYRYQ